MASQQQFVPTIALYPPFTTQSAPISNAFILPPLQHTKVPSPFKNQNGWPIPFAPALSPVLPNDLAFYAAELDVSRLKALYNHLWLAGLERPARPLHYQLALGRRIVVTENASLHLLWEADRLYLKPLPDWLLNVEIWESVLCRDVDTHESANGFLLSWLWLVCYRSDLKIAHEMGFIDASIDWEAWTRFVREVMQRLDYRTLKGVHVRYRRGELRLQRVNFVYRITGLRRKIRVERVLRGYNYGYHHYASFFADNVNWMAAVAVYAALVLTAMQVGLATDNLKGDKTFNSASYGFTVFSILTPVIVTVVVALVTLVLVVNNWLYLLRNAIDWSSA